jgi:putative oxidoreductase
MKMIKKLNKWTNSHNPFFLLDILRWFLGGFLFFKGINFMTDSQYLLDIISPNKDFFASMIIYQYVTMVQLGGGLLIIFGLLTRISVSVQIPILIGAVAVNFLFVMNSQNLIEASVILLLSLFFIIAGSGKHSADYNLKMEM